MWKPRFPVVKHVDNLKDYRHYVVQVMAIGSLEDSEGLFGKHEEGGGRSAWIVIRKGIRIRGTGVATFEGC